MLITPAFCSSCFTRIGVALVEDFFQKRFGPRSKTASPESASGQRLPCFFVGTFCRCKHVYHCAARFLCYRNPPSVYRHTDIWVGVG